MTIEMNKDLLAELESNTGRKKASLTGAAIKIDNRRPADEEGNERVRLIK